MLRIYKMILLSGILVNLMMTSTSIAKRPLVTDDVDIIKSYHYLFEIDGGYFDLGHKETKQEYNFILGKTFLENYEFSLMLPYEGRIVSPDKAWNFGEMQIQLKWKWLEEEKTVPGLGVKLGIKLPTGQENDTPSIGTGTTDVLIDIILQKSVSFLTFYGNIGYTLRSGNTIYDRIRAGLGTEHPLSESTSIFTELTGTTSTRPAMKDDTLELYTGFGHITRWGWSWDLGGVYGLTHTSPDWGVRLGTSSEF